MYQYVLSCIVSCPIKTSSKHDMLGLLAQLSPQEPVDLESPATPATPFTPVTPVSPVLDTRCSGQFKIAPRIRRHHL